MTNNDLRQLSERIGNPLYYALIIICTCFSVWNILTAISNAQRNDAELRACKQFVKDTAKEEERKAENK